MKEYKLQDWLPTTKKEIELRGWDYIDVILFSGDAYVDHPSFGAAVIGRTLESEGLRVAIVPQPNWRDDLRDFKKLGQPRLFFGISAGAMDSMVNHYTANKRLRSDDAYTPDGRAGMRPDYPTIVYTQILKKLYPDVPVVIGGIEASLRRLTHYDYWENRLRPSILVDSKADLLIYGMGEKPIRELVARLLDGETVDSIKDIRQTVVITSIHEIPKETENDTDVVLASHEQCLANRKLQSANFKHIETESNKYEARRLWQKCGDVVVKVNVPFPPISEEEIDASFDLPYTRLPHPKYKGKTIPAYEMIKFSVNLHRGCFGGCAFCTISAHQGKFIASRSKQSILKEVKEIISMPDFKGYLSDLGGPSANMYQMHGSDQRICRKCKRPSCIYPEICPNLNTDHTPLLDIYHSVDALKGIKKSFIGSGVRYDLLQYRHKDEKINEANKRYTKELISRHVSGRLKVAPEHTSDRVLNVMRKPSFKQFETFKKTFDTINQEEGLKQQIVPYFISSHPGCHEEDMAELAVITKKTEFSFGTGSRLHPYPDDAGNRNILYRISPLYRRKNIYSSQPRRKIGAKAIFLLV